MKVWEKKINLRKCGEETIETIVKILVHKENFLKYQFNMFLWVVEFFWTRDSGVDYVAAPLNEFQ